MQTRVEEFAHALGLHGTFREAASRAALLHDAGKADPRFQLWLYGSEVEAARNNFDLIAKSKIEARNPAAMEAARKRAGWSNWRKKFGRNGIVLKPSGGY